MKGEPTSLLIELYIISPLSYSMLLNLDHIILTLNVTEIIQHVAPKESIGANGFAEFRSLPDNNTLGLPGILCTNSSSNGVTILPPILDPWIVRWSTLEATLTETEGHLTISERFEMKIYGCVPESFTQVHLIITLPMGEANASVYVNYATVLFVGDDLHNRTLEAGDGECFMKMLQIINSFSRHWKY